MKEDTLWNSIGKQMPYRLPEGFFLEEEATLQQLAAKQSAMMQAEATRLAEPRPTTSTEAAPRALKIHLGWWIGGVAAVVALALITLLHFETTLQPLQSASESPLYAYHDAMTSDELDGWVEFYEADLFLAE